MKIKCCNAFLTSTLSKKTYFQLVESNNQLKGKLFQIKYSIKIKKWWYLDSKFIDINGILIQLKHVVYKNGLFITKFFNELSHYE